MTARERADELESIIRTMTKVGDISVRHGNKKVCLVRNIISYQMRKDGIRIDDIAAAMGRSHTTIVQLTNKFDSILAGGEENFYYGYTSEVALWKEFSREVARADSLKDAPVLSSRRVISLEEFRELTAGLPGDTVLKMSEGDSQGLCIKPYYRSGVLVISR